MVVVIAHRLTSVCVAHVMLIGTLWPYCFIASGAGFSIVDGSAGSSGRLFPRIRFCASVTYSGYENLKQNARKLSANEEGTETLVSCAISAAESCSRVSSPPQGFAYFYVRIPPRNFSASSLLSNSALSKRNSSVAQFYVSDSAAGSCL